MSADQEIHRLAEANFTLSIAEIWGKWQCGDAMQSYLADKGGFADFKTSCWAMDPAPLETNPKPLPYEDLKEGMSCSQSYTTPLRHGIPLVPKTSLTLKKTVVQECSQQRLKLVAKTATLVIGTEMEVTELYEYDGKRTHFTVDAVIIDSGKLPRSVVVPKALEATSEIYEGWFDLVNGTAPRKEEVVSKQWALDSQTILGSLLAIAFTIMVVNMYTVSLCLDGLSKMSMILAKMQ